MRHSSGTLERARLELKYCECCGGLWLRAEGAQESRCGACVGKATDFAGAWARGLQRRSDTERTARQRRLEILLLPRVQEVRG